MSEAAHSLHVEIEAARALLEHCKDVIGDDEIAIADAIEGQTNLDGAILGAMERIAQIEALEAGIASRLGNLKTRAQRLDAQKEGLRVALMVAMETAGKVRLETAVGTIALKRVPPKLQVVNEADIPSKFWKAQEPKLDKAKLTAALKEKEVVPGAQLDNGSATVQIGFR